MGSLKRFLLIWFAVILLIILGALFIPTDAKRVHRTLQACEKAVRAGDAGGLMAQIARDYDYQELDWVTFNQLTRAIFQRSQFASTVLYGEKIKIQGDVAEARFSVGVQTEKGSAIPSPHRTSWRLKLRREGRTWLIAEIELLTVNGNAIGTLRQAMEVASAMGRE